MEVALAQPPKEGKDFGKAPLLQDFESLSGSANDASSEATYTDTPGVQ